MRVGPDSWNQPDHSQKPVGSSFPDCSRIHLRKLPHRLRSKFLPTLARASQKHTASCLSPSKPTRARATSRSSFSPAEQGYTLFLTGNEAVLSLRRAPAQASDRDKLATLDPAAFRATDQNSAVLRMKLIGANTSAMVSGTSEQEGKSNYFIGNDPSQWRTNVSNYSQVRYQNAYPGVDLVYYGNQQQLEYDFVVAPGADPHAITLDVAAESAISGKRTSEPLRIADNGDLLIPTDGRRSPLP